MTQSYTEELLRTYGDVAVSATELATEHLANVLDSLCSEPKDDLAVARAFWKLVIDPLILRKRVDRGGTTSTFRPDDAYLDRAVHALGSTGVDIVIYLRLQQSFVPGLQPDTTVTMSGLEVLKYWGAKALAAEKLGLDLRFVICDESSGFPEDELLGFTRKSRIVSAQVIDAYLSDSGLAGAIVTRPLDAGIEIAALAETERVRLYEEFARLRERKRKTVARDITLGSKTFETSRVALFTQILTDYGWSMLNVPQTDVSDLRHLNGDGLEYLIDVMARFNSLLDVRATARELVASAGLASHAELWHPSRLTLHAGITRAAHRPSMLVLGKQWRGRSVMAAYGLPVYDRNRRCAGLIHQRDLLGDGDLRVVRIQDKAVCALAY